MATQGVGGESPARLWQKLSVSQRELLADYAELDEADGLTEQAWAKLPEESRVDLIGAFLDMQQAEAKWAQLSEGERGEIAAQLPSARRDYNERVAASTDWQGLPARTRVQLAALMREREPEAQRQEQREQAQEAQTESALGGESARAHPKFDEWVDDDGSQFVANQTEGSPLLLWDAFGREKRAQFAEYAGVELVDAKWQELPIETRERLTEAFAELDGVREVWGAMDRQQRQALFPVRPNAGAAERAQLRDLVATADISLQPAALLDIAAALRAQQRTGQQEAEPEPTTPTTASKATRAQASFAKLWDSWTGEARKVYASSFGIARGYNRKWAKLEPEARERLMGIAEMVSRTRRVWDKADVAERRKIAIEGGVSEFALAKHLAELPSKKWGNISPEFWPQLVMGHRILEGLRNPRELGRPQVSDLSQSGESSMQQDGKAQEQRAKLLALWEFLFGENREAVATLKGTEFAGGDSGKLRFRIAEWYAKNGNAVVTVEGVGPVKLDVPAVEHSLSHGRWRQKIAAFAAVPDVLRKGQLIHREPLRGARDGGEFLHFAAPIQIGGREYIADVMVKTDSKGSRMYLHDVILTEKLRQPASQSGADAVGLSTEAVEVPTGEQSASTGAGVAERVLRRIYAVKSEAATSAAEKQGKGKTYNSNGDSDRKSGGSSSNADLASPLNLRQPNAAATSLEGTPEAKGKKPVSSTAVMNAIAKVAEAVGRDKRSVNRVGFISKRSALGVYNPGSGVTRIRTAGDTTTAAHELAHLIDDALWGRDSRKANGLPAGHSIMLGWRHWQHNSPNLSDEARAELHRLGKQLYGNKEPHNGYHSEGFAEFVRLWLTDEKQAREKAPQFTKFWEGVLKERPKLAEAIAAASALAHQFLAQGSVARGIASIVKQPTRTQALVEGTKKEVSSFLKKWLEAGAAIEAFSEEAARLRGDADGKLPTALDPFKAYKAYRLGADAIVEDWAMHGMTDAGRNRTGVAPLNDAFTLVGNDKADAFVVYLWAKRTVALYDDPKNGPRNSGLAIEDAQQILEELGSPQFERAAGIFYAWGEGVLDYVAEMSPALAEMVERIRAVDPGSYIPLKREFADLDRQYRASGGGSAARAQLTKRLKGSGRRIKHPVESMIAQAKDMVHKAHQRRVIDQVLHLARSVKGLGHLAVEVPVAQVPIAQRPMAELLQKVEQIMGSRGAIKELLEETGQSDLFEEMVTFYGPAAEPKAGEWPVLPVWEEGKMKWFELDPELYAALAHMDRQTLSTTAEFLGGKWARAFRLGTTGLNATNPSRDFWTLLLNSRANGSRGEVFMAWLGAMRDTVLYQMTGGRVGTDGGDIMRRLGVEMAQPLGQDTRPLERTTRRIMNGGKWNPMSIADWVDGLRKVLSMSEMAPRLAEVRLVAKRMGIDLDNMTRGQAVELSVAGKEVTTDFTAAGELARYWNSVIPFLNAGIQGKVAHARAFKRNPTQFLITAFSMTVGGLVLWSLYRDEEWWQEMTPEERYGYVYIPFFGELIRIPLPFEIGGLFVSGPMALIDAWYQEEPARAAGWLRTFLEDVGQFEMVEFEQLGGKSVPVPQLPVLGRLVGEQLSNKSFHYGSPIVPRWQQDLPPEEQYGPYTTRAAVEIGQALGVSPRRVEHAIRSVFGGVAMDVAALAGRGNPRVVKREWEAADTPVFGRLFHQGGQAARRPKSVDELYEVYDEALKRNRSRVQVETELQKQQRLMLGDAVRAIGVLGDVAQATAEREMRQHLQSEQIRIAKEVVGLIRAGKVNRQLGKNERDRALYREENKLRELGGQKQGTGTRQLRRWTTYGGGQ